MRIIAIVNQKGGVAKTTTAAALGAGLRLRGFRVLLIDLDAQGNLSYILKAEPEGPTAMEVISQKATAQEAIWSGEQGDLIPSSPMLATADIQITDTGKEYRLREALEPLKGSYDYCIVDTTPSLGILTVNAMTAAAGIIVPSQADVFSLTGVASLNKTVERVRQYTNQGLAIFGILLVRHNSRAVISRDMADAIQDAAHALKTKMFKSAIRECVVFREAQAFRQDIFSYAPKSNAALDYADLVAELIAEEA